ncbi:MAG: hypothetical protein V3R81_04355 [Gammaproteobacteria bacterium]
MTEKETQETKPEIAKPAPKKPTDWESGKHSVLKLSLHTGNRIPINGHNPGSIRGPGPMHRAAASLHGWDWHVIHYVDPVEMTKKDYLAAIKAAGSGKTHQAAMAPHFPPKES